MTVLWSYVYILISLMPGQRRIEAKLYGKAKVSKQFMITEQSLAAIDGLADEMGLSRSETLERILRTFDKNAVKYFDPEVPA